MTTVVSSLKPPIAIRWRKPNGRVVVLGKVYRQLNGSLALGTPYRNRHLATPSLPDAVLRYLTDSGVDQWVIRLDARRRAYALRLEDVRRVGELRADGEWYVWLGRFKPLADWPDWPYASAAVIVKP